MDLIDIPKDLKRAKGLDELMTTIVGQVRQISKFAKSPLALDLSHYVATLIENLVTKKGTDKMRLAFDIFLALFPTITASDLQIVQRNIEYLLTINVVKKTPILRKVLHYSYEIATAIFKKKFME
jgi:hypothetical protein